MSGADGSIERLEKSVASRIAAGEVIERPVSAAKELLENSIDAGASDVRITLEQGGKASLVAEDNGHGIAYGDLPLAVERYATSKIRTLDDLEYVMTLGYRGEALSSIASVSRFELRSRRQGEESGGVIRVEGGVPSPPSRVPAPPGTRVEISDLFYNLPARRKFLKSATAELKRIVQVVQDYALVYPRTRFRLSNDGKNLLDLGGAASTDEVLKSIWGEEHRSVHAESGGGYERAGHVSIWWNNLPGSRRVNVTAFVNGRRVQDSTIRAALNSTGASIYGEWIVMAVVPPEDVDVNIHPAKAEVRFRNSSHVFELVRKCAESALLDGGGFVSAVGEVGASGVSGASVHTPPPIAGPFDNYVPPPERFKVRSEFFSQLPGETAKTESPDSPLFPGESLGPVRRYLGQAQGGYLVFDDPRGLVLVDAHAAHERILYEEIESSYEGRRIDAQTLLSGQELPSAVAAGASLHREELAGMGFAFKLPGDDGNGEGSSLLMSVPVLKGLGRLSPMEMLRSAIRGIEEEDDPSKRDREVWWRWARTACRDAIKLGAAVSEEEASDLFDRLERCRSPYSCPHGRPTTIFLAGAQLKSWFER